MGPPGGSTLAAQRTLILTSVQEYFSNQDGIEAGGIDIKDALPAPDILIYTNQCETFHILPWAAGMEGQPYLRMLEMHWSNEAVQTYTANKLKAEQNRQKMLARSQHQ